MSRQDFFDQLVKLGYQNLSIREGLVSFPYSVPLGRFQDQQIELGFDVPADFSSTPPSGPHIKPELLPRNNQPNGTHPTGGIHESGQFGAGWQYWSRPFKEWADSDRTVKTYMAHIRKLFDQ
jgi:hypothetical protein